MAENRDVLITEMIMRLIEGKKYASVRDAMETMHAADIAAILEECPKEQVPLVFRLLPKELAAETFAQMEEDHQELLIKSFSDSELKEVVDELYVDDAANLVGEMPANVVKRILRQADPEKRKLINEILKYPEDSAGSIMTTEYVSLRPDMTLFLFSCWGSFQLLSLQLFSQVLSFYHLLWDLYNVNVGVFNVPEFS